MGGDPESPVAVHLLKAQGSSGNYHRAENIFLGLNDAAGARALCGVRPGL
jgi:hypothetical protein